MVLYVICNKVISIYNNIIAVEYVPMSIIIIIFITTKNVQPLITSLKVNYNNNDYV